MKHRHLLAFSAQAVLLTTFAAAGSGDGAVTCEMCRAEWAGPESAERTRPGYDEATGRDLSNFPPHRLADYQHMRLELFIADMNQARLEGVETLTLEPIGQPLSDLRLDARGMNIASVTVDGRTCAFTYDGESLNISFDPPLEPAKAARLVITYAVTSPVDGLNWFPESPAWPGRPAQLHTQGQPQTISALFPCHDFPNERLTTELLVTVPAGYTVSSNGRLVGRTNRIITVPDGAGTKLAAYEQFHWLQDKPHVNYLVSLVIGKFDIVDVGTRNLPMPVYVPPGRGVDVKATYGKTPDMVAHFSKLLDEPYPWDRYAQLVVWNFAAGGMENTGATTMYDTAILDKAARADTDLEGLISHELGHQWFGDLVTCNSWEHVWLNEGFATYMTALWEEHERGSDGYQSNILGNMDGVRGGDKADAPYRPGLTSRIYKNPWEPFRRPANPYSKGSSILHMLRERLGDEAFFRGIALYIDRCKFRTAETSDLRRALEDISGESLQQFFDQWCARPGFPVLDIRVEWHAATSTLDVHVEQAQNIDPYNPAYEFELPVWVDVPDAARAATSPADRGGRWIRIPVSSRSAAWSGLLPAEPTVCIVDPDMTVLADLRIDQPAGRWIKQLNNGPTLAARAQAARALGRAREGDGARDLRRMADNRSAHKSVRAEAVRALAARDDWETLGALVNTANDTPDIREAICDALAEVASREEVNPGFREFAGQSIERRARQDSSSRVRAAAIRGLARMKAPEAWSVVSTGLNLESQDDRVRQAALTSLSRLDREEALPLAIERTRPGVLSRTRPIAIQAVVDLAHHDKDAAFEAIAPLMADNESRTRDAAGQALADLKDPRGIPVLEEFIGKCRDRRIRERAQDWLDSLRKSASPEPSPEHAPAARS